MFHQDSRKTGIFRGRTVIGRGHEAQKQCRCVFFALLWVPVYSGSECSWLVWDAALCCMCVRVHMMWSVDTETRVNRELMLRRASVPVCLSLDASRRSTTAACACTTASSQQKMSSDLAWTTAPASAATSK